MKSQRLLGAITIANLVLLLFLLGQTRIHIGWRGIHLETNITGSVLRGRALEIIDENGRTRASIRIFPAADQSNGTTYPEAVLLRLISSDGRPNVKLAATEDGSALVLGGESDPTLIHLLARGATTSLQLRNKDNHEQLLKP